MYRIYWNQNAALIGPLISSFFFLQFLNKIFRHTFLRLCEAWKVDTWYTTWIVGRCIVFTGIRLMLLISPFISSFFFLSNFQTLKIFVSLFSGTVRLIKLKLDTHMDNGWMFVYVAIRLLRLICPLFLYFSFSPVFRNFRHTFLRNYEA